MDALVFVVLLLQGSGLLLASNHDDDCISRTEVQMLLRNMKEEHEEAVSFMRQEIDVLKRLLASGNPTVKDSPDVQRSGHLASEGGLPSILMGDTAVRRFVVADGAIEQGVAFSVTIGTSGLEHLGPGQTILFDDIISNLGNAFDANISVFQVPVKGWYVFSLTLMSRPNEKEQLNVMRNRVEIFHCYADGNEFNSASKTVVVHAEKGDDIWVQAAVTNSNVQGYSHTSFTGFLLYPA